jgi:hypothetical protein
LIPLVTVIFNCYYNSMKEMKERRKQERKE